MKRRTPVVAAALVLAAFATACGSDEPASSSDAADVQATSWRLVEISGDTVPDDVEVTLVFDGSTISGTGGCNQYSAGAEFENGDVSVDANMISTLMACDGAAGEIEGRYFEALPRTTGFVVIDSLLRLDDGGDEPLLVYAASE